MALNEAPEKDTTAENPTYTVISSQKTREKRRAKRAAKQSAKQKLRDEKASNAAEAARKRCAPKSTQRTIGYELMYEDGICALPDLTYSKTVKMADINYKIARREDQFAIFSKWNEFHNYFDPTIEYSISLLNRTIDPNMFKNQVFLADRQNDVQLQPYVTEYNDMLFSKIMQGQNSVVRDKYVTFTTSAANHDSAVPALARIETDIINNLKAMGCDSKALTGGERLEILHQIFAATDEAYNFDYGELVRNDLTTKDYISPVSFKFEKSSFEFGEKFGQVLFLRDLPADLSDKVLAEITDIPVNMCVTLHFNSVEQDKALKLVKTKIVAMEGNQIDEQRKAGKAGYSADLIPMELRRSLGEARELLDDLQNKNQRMFKATVLIMVWAESAAALKDNVYQISAVARKNGCRLANLTYQQEDGMNSSLVLGKNHINIQRTLTSASAAIFVPFTTQELFQSGGLYYGLNAQSRNIVKANRKLLLNGNGFILGTSGSGKSFAAKREMINVFLGTDDEVIVIDPQAEYVSLAENFGGEVIHVSAGSNTHINPLDITEDYADDEDPILLKSEFILSLCELIIGGHNGLEQGSRTVVDRAVTDVYTRYFNAHGAMAMPTLVDFYEELKKQPEEEAKQVLLALEIYVKGSLRVFAQPTNVNTQSRFVVYDIKDLGKSLKTLGMLIVLDNIWNKITANQKKGVRTWIYIDEIYLLFANEYSANYLFELWKRVRKWGGIPTGITQDVEDLLQSSLARRMLSNSEFLLLLNQAASDRNELSDLLKISSEQLGYVTNAAPGQGLLISGSSIIPFIDKFPPGTRLYKLMTTNPEELEVIRTAKKEDNGGLQF